MTLLSKASPGNSEPGLHEISHAAKISGVSAKMIRYYESIGLIPPATRSRANYRLYSNQSIQMLCLLKQTRALGFSMEQIAALLNLWANPQRASAEVKQLVLAQVDKLEQMIAEMQVMRDTLQQLAQDCHGNQQPDCAILDKLSDRH
ncbi:Cu(I)-responsive transcriptional regulator [Neisseriaceae bacterium TC5R-5]|nr:Cu(I)-responsive transcriptional regulator [Neisseriaceae bacterium TC5R-5]